MTHSIFIESAIHFNAVAKQHDYLALALFLSSMIGNMLDAGIVYSIIISVFGTVILFMIWKE